MKYILGLKKEMTQKFHEDGRCIPVTGIAVSTCSLTALKTKDRDGYTAVQLACQEGKNVKKPQKGHFKELGNFRIVREFRVSEESMSTYTLGQTFDASLFEPGDRVMVTAKSKGRGFQGVVKRHHFAGHPSTHGHKDQERMPGTQGAGGVQNVKKGKRMGGRMGGENITVKNLEVIEVDVKSGMLFIKGAVPGARNSLVIIRSLS